MEEKHQIMKSFNDRMLVINEYKNSDNLYNKQIIEKELNNHIKAEVRRMKRLRKRLRFLLEKDYCYFITFTIKDNYINNSINTFLQKLRKKVLKNFTYVFNVDYGAKNGRLHFHCVLGLSKKLTSLDYKNINKLWGYGAVDYKPILIKKDSNIQKYLTKQQLHMTKETAGKIYFSRLKNKA